MTITIIGTFVLDTIHHMNGSIVNSIGGVSYAIAIISQLVSTTDIIIPISRIGYDASDAIKTFLSTFRNVNIQGLLHASDAMHTRVNLFYTDAENRYEILSNPFTPLSYENVSPFLNSDVLLLNYITGFELDLQTHIHVCNQAIGLVYMDFHSLTLGRDDDGRRYPCYVPEWGKWLDGVDILQLNEHEAALLNRSDDYAHFASSVFEQGVQILNITLGAQGSLLYYRQGRLAKFHHIKSYYAKQAVDVTGCGDAFACGFIIDYLSHGDPLHAAKAANYVAGFNSTLSGLTDIHHLAILNDTEALWKKF